MQNLSLAKLTLLLGCGAAVALSASPALADDTTTAHVEVTPATTSAPPAVAEKSEVARPSERRTGRGVGLGLDQGLFGRAYEQGLRIRVPILDHFAVHVRGVSTLADRPSELGWYVGGRLELVGHSPVYLNLVRLYGGGGPEVAVRAAGASGDKTIIGGGGQFGFEFFLGPKMSFFAEIGGHSGGELEGGGTALAGMMFYPFTGP